MIGRVLEAALRETAASGTVPPNYKAALARVGLWDRQMNRPDDRVAAIRRGNLERGFAMHKALTPSNVAAGAPEAVARYATLELSSHGRAITAADVRAALLDWPRDWLRFTVNGAVPLDCLLIGLVSAGFDAPVSFQDFGQGSFVTEVRKVTYLSSGGMTFDWPNVEVPSRSGPA